MQFNLDTLSPANTYDLKQQNYGRVWALRMGPYGIILALAWESGMPARLVDVENPTRTW
eukprot:CAMPEP_0202905876 /NCGR_PEP_ID=MMETSP1392-20130828/36453_1 /ASSEMBLY_ACC=CAM_ASM_000868 /TAXON_ID=225041 /ORGANISM="Chlamydomonas chlamydogama, Strain SAG 11-48b" /LENGTH=58 /DNA_ID=CAMNT_0049594173 /DNA_START=1 /DNA_END=174 /DNA_ORIENTATION=+